ncbi:Stk1 family PASTA domain-containing Ser/Thr kinase [Brachybacterium kimchii]|uniref:non-specific serine/threonine protein kinase n=1 Tax=Brachybacterium kimchii TaxID=2942909 RepID=A0ABY4NBZ2_9MICO|nr:Stk1 family PASTA domain-containing Ser/Thr kinase [Brachybacterium kimchii]UQN30949.1 Stk1 family PASTA domain-containing Ser/Thr kinase [Brachybacterium kimchii]
MSAPATSPDTGVLLDDRYAVEELIARGGMATVYRGHDERLDRTVALKIMHPHLAVDEQFRRRFAREARSAARLAHPHVVGVFDQGEDDDRIYLSMELIEGGTLRNRITDAGRLTVREALEDTEQILEALDAAHTAGIVHRDIKPENILLAPGGSVKVADFGLARAIGTANTSASSTLLGTVAYISPEVVTRGHCDARSDLYSLGVVLYEMLTGIQPYTGEQAVHIAFQHVHEDMPAPSARVSTVPREVDSLVTWACARDPQHRPRGAGDLLAGVRDLLRTLPAAVLDAAPSELHDVDTQDVPRLTAHLDDVDLAGEAAARAFPLAARLGADDAPDDDENGGAESGPARIDEPEAAEAGGAAPAAPADTASPAQDDASSAEDAGASSREVALPAVRPRRGRHLARPLRGTSRGLRAAAVLAVVGSLAAGGASAGHWYLHEGPGGDRTVPALAGTDLDAADASLTSQDLETATSEAFSDSVPAGHVISSTPAAGTLLKRDESVKLVVSKGVETFPVPTVTGKSLEDAKKAVEDQGLTLVQDDGEYSEKVPSGQVISQSAAQDALPEGGEVHVVVSKGRVPISIPDQTGRSEDQARSALEDAGFTVTTSTKHSDVAKGKVASQSPAGGSAHRGDTVQLVISSGPEMVKVPNVFNKSEKDAKAALTKAGFTPKVQYDRGAPVLGTVYAQSTNGGEKAAKGSTITISVF